MVSQNGAVVQVTSSSLIFTARYATLADHSPTLRVQTPLQEVTVNLPSSVGQASVALSTTFRVFGFLPVSVTSDTDVLLVSRMYREVLIPENTPHFVAKGRTYIEVYFRATPFSIKLSPGFLIPTPSPCQFLAPLLLIPQSFQINQFVLNLM